MYSWIIQIIPNFKEYYLTNNATGIMKIYRFEGFFFVYSFDYKLKLFIIGVSWMLRFVYFTVMEGSVDLVWMFKCPKEINIIQIKLWNIREVIILEIVENCMVSLAKTRGQIKLLNSKYLSQIEILWNMPIYLNIREVIILEIVENCMVSLAKSNLKVK